jgi:hypothetical protein
MLLTLLLAENPLSYKYAPVGLLLLMLLFLLLEVWGIRILLRDEDPTRVRGILLMVAGVVLPQLLYEWLLGS